MQRTSTTTRIQRLEQITARLKTNDDWIIGDLAAELGVSVRTLTRDIRLLREQGLPIEADRGRGGGVRLHWSWGIGRVNFNYAEAVDLLVSLAVAEQMKSPLLMANLSTVRRKLMASFAPFTKRRINALRSRILVGESSSPFVLSTFTSPKPRVVALVHQAFLMMRKLTICYRDVNGTKTDRVIELQYLLLSYPVWYAIAWDELRDDVRTFRCDRIETSKLSDDEFRARPLSQFTQAIEGIDAIQP